MVAIKARPEIYNLSPAHHGAFDYGELEQLGLNPNDVLDFSVSSNPYGPSPAVRQALASVPLERYPDRECLALRRAVSEHWDIPVEQVLVGNGSAELLWLAAIAYLRPNDTVMVLSPTFGEYERVANLMGARIVRWTAQRDQAFTFEPQDVARQLAEACPRLVFVCSPNNPTGVVVPLDVLATWANENQHTLFVVDEAYLAFAPGLPSAATMVHPHPAGMQLHRTAVPLDNILVLRSMTKDYALAGLRLGYAVGPSEVIRVLASVRPPWNVNAMAQAAGLAALSDQVYMCQTLAALRESKTALAAALAQLGWRVLPSAVHFFLLDVGNGAAFRQSLLHHGVQVRDCASFGLPDLVRIAPRRPEENTRLLETVQMLHGKKCMSQKGPDPNTYWVNPQLLAGEYPGDRDPKKAREKIARYLNAGVTFFLDLTEEGELMPYAPLLAEGNSPPKAVHKRMPIKDVDVPPPQTMNQILDTIDQAIAAGHTVYVHCWGGVGRTGAVIGCYLVRHGLTGSQALDELARLWAQVEKSGRRPCTPETGEQMAMVKNWERMETARWRK